MGRKYFDDAIYSDLKHRFKYMLIVTVVNIIVLLIYTLYIKSKLLLYIGMMTYLLALLDICVLDSKIYNTIKGKRRQ